MMSESCWGISNFQTDVIGKWQLLNGSLRKSGVLPKWHISLPKGARVDPKVVLESLVECLSLEKIYLQVIKIVETNEKTYN